MRDLICGKAVHTCTAGDWSSVARVMPGGGLLDPCTTGVGSVQARPVLVASVGMGHYRSSHVS